jgi:hypothetical protein
MVRHFRGARSSSRACGRHPSVLTPGALLWEVVGQDDVDPPDASGDLGNASGEGRSASGESGGASGESGGASGESGGASRVRPTRALPGSARAGTCPAREGRWSRRAFARGARAGGCLGRMGRQAARGSGGARRAAAWGEGGAGRGERWGARRERWAVGASDGWLGASGGAAPGERGAGRGEERGRGPDSSGGWRGRRAKGRARGATLLGARVACSVGSTRRSRCAMTRTAGASGRGRGCSRRQAASDRASAADFRPWPWPWSAPSVTRSGSHRQPFRGHRARPRAQPEEGDFNAKAQRRKKTRRNDVLSYPLAFLRLCAFAPLR